MSDYNIIKRTIQNEGGYINNKADKGGETYCGISRVYNPTWNGWFSLDKIKDKNQAYKDGFLYDEVIAFYYDKYFKKMKLEKIANQDLRACVFDFCVNSGQAVKVIQQMLNTKYRANLITDNIFGEQIAFTLNRIPNQTELNNNIVDARKQYITNQTKNGAISPIFLQGLLKRAENYRITKINSLFEEFINFFKRLFS